MNLLSTENTSGQRYVAPYGAVLAIPADLLDTTWYEFSDAAGNSVCLDDPRIAAAEQDAWLEEKKRVLPGSPPIVAYEHPTLRVRGVSYTDPESGKTLTVLSVAGQFGVRTLMLTGRFDPSAPVAFVSQLREAASPGPGWVVPALLLPLADTVQPPKVFSFRGPAGLLRVSWKPTLTFEAPSTQALEDNTAGVEAATPECYVHSDQHVWYTRYLDTRKAAVTPTCFVAQALLRPPPQHIHAPIYSAVRPSTPVLQLELTGNTAALPQLWQALLQSTQLS